VSGGVELPLRLFRSLRDDHATAESGSNGRLPEFQAVTRDRKPAATIMTTPKTGPAVSRAGMATKATSTILADSKQCR
jgi:hypothetical protein